MGSGFGTTLAPATNFGVWDVAQSGSTIYAISGNTTAGNFFLEKSVDGGATWATAVTGITPAAQTFRYVAVAPDDPNYVVMIDTAANVAYLSTTGGTLFSSLGAPGVGALRSVTISPKTLYRYITVGGATGLATMTMGVAVPAWVADATRGAIYAVAYSSNFAADAGLIAVAANTTSNVTSLQVYSRNLLQWNPTGYGYPIVISPYNAAGVVINRASITLDTNFYLGDAATQIGFVGISGTAGALFSGVYRFDLNTAGTASQIFSTTGVNSVAWDGTNLMVAPYDVAPGGALTIYRSSNALAPVGVAAFLPSSSFKTPGMGTLPLVLFNSGTGYAFSRGIDSAVASTTDLGKTFNGFALINSNFNLVSDFTVSPDGSRIYAVVDDGKDINTWTWSAGAWSRIMVTSNITGTTFLVRQDANTPATVYLGQKNGTTMYKSADAGQTWVTRASVINIADFAVQDINNVYVAPNTTATLVYKSINGAFTWTPYVTTITAAGVGYSLTIIADNQVALGSTTGYVAYTADGATWASLPAPLTAGNTVVTADMLTAGGMIFAASPASSVSSWKLGTSVAWTATAAATANVTGIVESNGVVYAESNTGLVNNVYRFLNPAFGAGFFYETRATGPTTITPTNIVNTLQASTAAGHNVVWARATNTYGPVDTIDCYNDYLISAAQALVPIYPINNAKIGVNSLNGNVSNFVFQWNAPAALPATPAQAYTYDIGVYLDQLGTISMGFSPAVAGSLGGVATSYNQAAFNAATGLSLQPGTTYYWQVRTNTPVWSYWSPMATFSVQQLAAIVPVLSSPASGFTVAVGMTPAFSWNPIASVQTYKFQVSSDPTFATTVYDTTTASAGAAIPATVKLTAGMNYFWRVKTLTPAEGDWSAVSNFSIAKPVVTTVAPTQAPPTLTVILPPVTTTSIVIPPATTTTTEVNPSYIWAIIIIGAVLVIAVIVLIVRTRRSV